MDSDYKDVLITMYVQNEHYHDTKEKVLWLAGTIYFAFSAVVMKWLLEMPRDWFVDNRLQIGLSLKWPVLAFLVLIFGLVLWYLWFQHKMKLRTLDTFDRLGQIISYAGDDYKTLMNRPQGKTPPVPIFRRRYVPGLVVILAATVFFLAQVALIFTKS